MLSWDKITIFFILNVLFFKAHSQDCPDFHTRYCPIPDFSYYYDQQSGSFSLKEGEIAELRVIVFEKNDYYVSVCSQKKDNSVHLRILEDTPEKKVIYDNEKNDYINYVSFSNDVTRKLIFEVVLRIEKEGKISSKQRCVGILVAKRIRVEAF